MNDITIDGGAFRLRPVKVQDAELIVRLRTDPQRSKFIHATSPDVAKQQAWLDRTMSREDEWFFIVECIGDGNPEGTICLYHLEGEAKTANAKSANAKSANAKSANAKSANAKSANAKSAEWGRWVLLTGSLAAPESALLIYRVGFDQLGLREMYCRTEEENQPVVSFHASCGLVDRGIVNGPNGEVWREQVATVEEWPGIQARMQRHADMSRRLLSRS